MGEDEAVLEAAAACGGGALATVLSVEGSAYRRAGARMFVRPDGSTVGGVSGGCLEAEVAAEALEAAASGRSRVLRFDTTDPDDAVTGYGSGCAGVVEVLVEPRGPAAADLGLAASAAVRATRQPGVLVTATAGPSAGGHGWWHRGRWTGPLAEHLDGDGPHAGLPGARLAREVLEPPVRLVLVGADAGSPELARAARLLGWEVLVVDFRPQLLQEGRFPDGVRLRQALGSQLGGAVPVDAGTAVVVASRHWLYDLAAVSAVLGEQRAAVPLYVGLVGSRPRVARLLADALGDGPHPAVVRAPAGLALGARTPAEIAAAVVGEVLAVRSSRPAPLLTASTGASRVDRPV